MMAVPLEQGATTLRIAQSCDDASHRAEEALA